MAKLIDISQSDNLVLSKFYKTKEERLNSTKPVSCNYENIYYPTRGEPTQAPHKG